MAAAAAAAEQELLRYLEECYAADAPLSSAAVRATLAGSPPRGARWSARSEDGMPALHLAVMNEATEPAELAEVVAELLACGAEPNAVDEDGDTALEAVLQLAGDAEADGASSESAKQANLAAVRALVRCPELQLGTPQVLAICSWLRHHMPTAGRSDVLQDLEMRVGKAPVARAWASEELLAYLEQRSYEEKRGVEARRVKEFLDRGAMPSHTQNGATALLLVVLNPYTSYSELVRVFGMMLQADPGAAAVRDGFKLSPMQWAADYVNVAQQHGLRRPNPAVLLALLPSVLALVPLGSDTGEVCLKAAPEGGCPPASPQGAPSTRFLEGHRVLCCVDSPGGAHDWEEGVVVGLWYREACWPAEHPGAPYLVLLDIGARVFALADDERIVRAEAAGAPRAPARPAAARPASRAEGAPAGGGPRFQKRQRPDGAWERLDTVSGKARACSPPSSDDED